MSICISMCLVDISIAPLLYLQFAVCGVPVKIGQGGNPNFFRRRAAPMEYKCSQTTPSLSFSWNFKSHNGFMFHVFFSAKLDKYGAVSACGPTVNVSEKVTQRDCVLLISKRPFIKSIIYFQIRNMLIV